MYIHDNVCIVSVLASVQVLRLGTELEQLQAQVESSEQRVGEMRKEAEERENEAQEEGARDRVERERIRCENERLVGVASQQELELKKSQKALSELHLEKEKLEVAVSGRESTITSLHLQVREREDLYTGTFRLCMYLLLSHSWLNFRTLLQSPMPEFSLWKLSLPRAGSTRNTWKKN